MLIETDPPDATSKALATLLIRLDETGVSAETVHMFYGAYLIFPGSALDQVVDAVECEGFSFYTSD